MRLQVLIFLFFPLSLFGQSTLDVDLTYGVYMDDHAARKFTARERIWKLNQHTLSYSIDAHNVRYSDTLELTNDEFNTVALFINEKNMVETVRVEMESHYAIKHGYSEVIRGHLKLDDDSAEIKFSANALHMLTEHEQSQSFYELEQLFYQFIEDHR